MAGDWLIDKNTLLPDKGKITQEMIAMLSKLGRGWRHSGFLGLAIGAGNVCCGNRISPDNDTCSPPL